MQEVLTHQDGSAAAASGRPQPHLSAPRRERKKQRTRDALIEAALELFESKGYEHTTVREITDAVDVAERTFFRHFASKEDLALSFARTGSDALLQALDTRPPEEEPLTALWQAFRESLRIMIASESGQGRKPAYLTAVQLIESTPTLLAASLRDFRDHGEALARKVAAREGVDPDTDPRPRIIVTLFAGLTSLATRDWRAAAANDAETLLAALDRYADRLGPELFGHWTESARTQP
jgi:AcrR family transcriptional regulator